MKQNSFTVRLRELRNSQKLTTEQLGKLLNISRNTITTWETRGTYPNNELMIKLADYFNVSIDYLMGRTENKVPVNKYAIDENTIVISERDYSPEQIEAIKAILKIKK